MRGVKSIDLQGELLNVCAGDSRRSRPDAGVVKGLAERVGPWLAPGNWDLGRVPSTLTDKRGSLGLNCLYKTICFLPNTCSPSGVWDLGTRSAEAAARRASGKNHRL